MRTVAVPEGGGAGGGGGPDGLAGAARTTGFTAAGGGEDEAECPGKMGTLNSLLQFGHVIFCPQ